MLSMGVSKRNNGGFTLIEMSIVLVIIGLIVGGILVGQDLIRSAYIRAQITQIEKLNTAVNTFYGKYQALPGDMNASVAQGFGFTPRVGVGGVGGLGGLGDGNGIIEIWHGQNESLPADLLATQSEGCCFEITLFWVDLTTANGQNLNLVDGSFTTHPTITLGSTGLAPDLFIPSAKLGAGNYVYAWGVGGVNYWGLSGVSIADGSGYNPSDMYANITVQQAYRIDKKIDDGFPQSGNVTAQFIGNNCYGSACSNGVIIWPGGDNGATDTATPTPPSSTSCYDDGGHTGAVRQYSLSTNGGNAANCVLTFKFQ